MGSRGEEMEKIVENWEDIAGDMIEDGLKIEVVIVLVGRQFRVLTGLLTNALIEAGKIPSDTIVLSQDEAAFVE